ncbi:hypothetical protein [Candidatus Uabimicrobium sp. HlEnr_7]|uniref:hypothetical protein n=1 Tax=Candidatus Uabimicrobium helgolandensis TaxID=3095367 RepID=UPI00355829A8
MHFRLPRVIFLHGNTAVGVCIKHKQKGYLHTTCEKCGEQLAQTRLLYPIEEKNYHADQYIRNEWNLLTCALKDAAIITIFGYGAPSSDQSALELMQNSWRNKQTELTEVIDIRRSSELRNIWTHFHFAPQRFDIYKKFFKSWMACHPRRSVEAYTDQTIFAEFISNNPIVKQQTLEDVWEWFRELQ